MIEVVEWLKEVGGMGYMNDMVGELGLGMEVEGGCGNGCIWWRE